MQHVRAMPVDVFRQMLEMASCDEMVSLQLYITGQVTKGKKKSKVTEKRTYALIVKEDRVQFEGILLAVGLVLKDSENIQAIKSVRSVKEGRLLIMMEKD